MGRLMPYETKSPWERSSKLSKPSSPTARENWIAVRRLFWFFAWLACGAWGGWISVNSVNLCYPESARFMSKNGMDAMVYLMTTPAGPFGLAISAVVAYAWERTHNDCAEKLFKERN